MRGCELWCEFLDFGDWYFAFAYLLDAPARAATRVFSALSFTSSINIVYYLYYRVSCYPFPNLNGCNRQIGLLEESSMARAFENSDEESGSLLIATKCWCFPPIAVVSTGEVVIRWGFYLVLEMIFGFLSKR
jgi:hypothetical protein